jgi:5,10-methylenetetrahydromethanopterin reductase
MEIGAIFATSATTPEHIEAAERLGYRYAFVYDSPTFLADPFIVLALAAARTSHIQLGVCVLTPRLRHIVANAGAAATLGALAPGRVILVVGSGFTSQLMIGERPARWDEVASYVEGLRALLHGDEIEWNGSVIGLRHGSLSGLGPVPEIPIWVAAHGPKGYAVAARCADGVVTNPTHGNKVPGLDSLDRVFVLFYGTVLEPDEDLGSKRVLGAAGPAAAFQLHLGGEGVASSTPEWAEYHSRLESIDERRRHLVVHGGHLIEVSELERPLINSELIRRATGTGTAAEVRAEVDEISAAGTSGILYGPQGADIVRELTAFAEAAGVAPET